ncbi:hypothetical protein VTJ49DRAFT_3810 [Mycothermus thermophilus]|uniref:SPX domain-containing protein n=1 Tax=Humicola insolens TaxID=85995 RepID=A0ABR3VQF8_HUMIN
MKFGERFERESVPQWSLYNIDYNALKHHIKVHTTKDQATTAITIPGRGNAALNKFEDGFYDELCRQHDRVDLFVSSKADEIARRLQHVSGLIHRLILRCATSSSTDRMPLKRRQRFARYERMVLQCGHDIKLLQRFVGAQVVAFRKILKKYRKWTGSSALGSRFRENVLSDPKSFTKRDFSQLQSQHHDLLQTLRGSLPANLSVSGGNGGVDMVEDGYQPTPRSGARSSRPGVTFANPDPQPAPGYWNEYDHGSEAGDVERGGDDYVIYIDPDADDSFPGVKTLSAIFINPVRRLQRLIRGGHAPESDDLATPDNERTGLLSNQSINPSPYGTQEGLDSVNSPPPGSRGSDDSRSPTALGTDTDTDTDLDLDDDHDHDVTRGYGSGSDDHLTYITPGYPSSYYSAGGAGYDRYYGPHSDQRAVALFRDRVLFWATWGCFAVAFVLAGIAAVLIKTGKHKMRVEVDAGVILNTWFPHVQHPIIFSAPMLGVANGTLAAEVSKAGGIGVVPGGYNFLPTSPQLTTLNAELTNARSLLFPSQTSTTTTTPESPPQQQHPLPTLPVAVGFILCHPSFASHFLTTALPLLRHHRPRGVWLFAPRPDDEISSSSDHEGETLLARVIRTLREEGFVVMQQVGTVAAARRAAQAGAEVLVVQGVDAGGHQFAGGAGVVSLVPEVGDMVAREFPGVVVVAAGGIVDGRGVVAGLGLGAEGVVMGTRFIASNEASTPDFSKKLILEASDGGPSTVKTSVLDDIKGTTIWPTIYDGRALVGKSWQDHAAGMPLEENIRLFKEAAAAGDVSRTITWAGTGVGLVREVKPAGEIVKEVREDAIRRIRELQATLTL